MANLQKSFAKTTIVGEKAKMIIANSLSKTIQKQPHRYFELLQLSVTLKLDHLLTSEILK